MSGSTVHSGPLPWQSFAKQTSVVKMMTMTMTMTMMMMMMMMMVQ